MRWAIVIGIDEYGSEELRLSAAVSDAVAFHRWVLDPAGGGVPESNCRLLLGRRAQDHGEAEAGLVPTKDAIVTAINDVVVAASAGGAERLYFYFAGHGITARVANRDESALVTPGFDALHTDHSLAVRSILEHFETTPFDDQFFFLDACRNVPWTDRDFEIGRWPAPRRRDPGARPVQQFVLYATSPGKKAVEATWPGEEAGAFTGTLLAGLAGEENAKAWSWERNRYEVRWERLADFVNRRMTQTASRPGVAPHESAVQVPQDTGARGVAGRERDVAVAAFPSSHFPAVRLTVDVATDAEYDEAELTVLDALGEPVVRALGVTGGAQTFELAPKTYAVRVTTTAPEALFGSLKAPVELFRDDTVKIELRPRPAPSGSPVVVERVGPEDLAPARSLGPGRIAIRSPDALALAAVSDEAGHVVALVRPDEELEARPGFYSIRHIGPEAAHDPAFIVLAADEREAVELPAPPPAAYAAELATALGGTVDDGYLSPFPDGPLMAWTRPSTVVTAALGAALQGADLLASPFHDLSNRVRGTRCGLVVLAVGDTRDDPSPKRLGVRTWPVGAPVATHEMPGAASPLGIVAAFEPAAGPGPCWVSLAPAGGDATVVCVPMLPGHVALLVAQMHGPTMQVFQHHPAIDGGPSADPSHLRRVEHLERLLVAGRLEGAEGAALEAATPAAADPFAALVAGYVLLRLGRHAELGAIAAAVVAAAPELSDGHILRAEAEAAAGRRAAADQAFVDAINAGIPVFAEGLTRLVEGLRAGGLTLPRAALVRHVFQRHARGSMWAAFNPSRRLEPGRPVISAADLGLEA